MGDKPTVDKLTGLLTRDALDMLDETFRERPGGVPWSVIIADIDDFKMINDIHGHLAGDRVLQQVSFVLLRTVRETDQVIRFGGDEFIAILPHTNASQAANVCQRFLGDVSREVYQHGQKVGVSMGLAESAESDRQLSQVVSKADAALYEAKALGKNRLSFYREKSRQTGKLSFDHFIDRQDQLKRLRSVLDEALEGGSRAVLITGEPGVGKSRLASELRHYCSFRECAFVSVKYDEIGGPGPFASLTEPLDALVSGMDTAIRDSIAREAGEVLPETAALFPRAPLAISTAPMPPEWARARTFYTQVSRIVTAVAAARPMAVFVDDLQWAYPQDLDLLGFLARTSSTSRILYLFGMRSPVEDEKESWDWMKGLMRLIEVERIDLHPLEHEHASNLVLLALRDPRVPQEILYKLTSASGGNPFYIREMLRALTDGGAIISDSGRWVYNLDDTETLPEGITLVVKSRLEQLERISREALRMGALIPGGFTASDLAFLMEIDAVEAAKALEHPLRIELIHQSGEDSGVPRYGFSHDCVRSILVSETSAGLRKQLFARLAGHLEEVLESGRPELLQKVAYCYSEGIPSGKAARYAAKVAAEAGARQATFEQALWLGRFLKQAEAWGGAEESEIFSSCVELANLHVMHARYDDAWMLLEKAEGLAAGAEQRGEVLAVRGYLLADKGDLTSAADAFEKAIESPIDPGRLARARLRLAYVRYLAGDFEKAGRLLDGQGEIAARMDDPLARMRIDASCLNLRGVIGQAVNGAAENLDLIRRAASIYEETGDALSRARVQLNLAALLGNSGAWEEQLKLLRGCLSSFTEVGDAQSVMAACMNLSGVHRALNQLDIAEDFALRALDLAEGSGSLPKQAGARFALAAIERRRGNALKAFELSDKAREIAGAIGQTPVVVSCLIEGALALAAAGEPMRADGLLKDAERLLEKAEFRPMFIPTLLFARGVLLYSDATVVDEEQNEQALRLLTESRLSNAQASDPLDILETMYYEAECLQRLEREDALYTLLGIASDLAVSLASGIESRASRADLLATPFITRLLDLCRRSGISTPEQDIMPGADRGEES